MQEVQLSVRKKKRRKERWNVVVWNREQRSWMTCRSRAGNTMERRWKEIGRAWEDESRSEEEVRRARGAYQIEGGSLSIICDSRERGCGLSLHLHKYWTLRGKERARNSAGFYKCVHFTRLPYFLRDRGAVISSAAQVFMIWSFSCTFHSCRLLKFNINNVINVMRCMFINQNHGVFHVDKNNRPNEL